MEWFLDRIVGAVALVAVFTPATEPCRVLDGLDHERAGAWAAGDPAALAQAHVGGTDAPDVAALEAYVDRGVRVTGARIERRRCEARGSGASVTERLGPAVAVTTDGQRHRLPSDQWADRWIGLEFDGRWRIAEVADVSAARE